MFDEQYFKKIYTKILTEKKFNNIIINIDDEKVDIQFDAINTPNIKDIFHTGIYSQKSKNHYAIMINYSNTDDILNIRVTTPRVKTNYLYKFNQLLSIFIDLCKL